MLLFSTSGSSFFEFRRQKGRNEHFWQIQKEYWWWMGHPVDILTQNFKSSPPETLLTVAQLAHEKPLDYL